MNVRCEHRLTSLLTTEASWSTHGCDPETTVFPLSQVHMVLEQSHPRAIKLKDFPQRSTAVLAGFLVSPGWRTCPPALPVLRALQEPPSPNQVFVPEEGLRPHSSPGTRGEERSHLSVEVTVLGILCRDGARR